MIWAGPGYPPQMVAGQSPARTARTANTQFALADGVSITEIAVFFCELGNLSYSLQQCHTSMSSLSDKPRYLTTMLALGNASGPSTPTPSCQLSASNSWPASRNSHIDCGKIARGQQINSEWMSTIRRQCARFTISQRRSTRQLGEPVG